MRDEKLKKGQIRIIVIATGFPEGAGETGGTVERSLFSLSPKEQTETRGKIYNEVVKIEEEEAPKKKEEPIVTATPQKREETKTVTPVVEEDDGFGVIPSFLRRNKK